MSVFTPERSRAIQAGAVIRRSTAGRRPAAALRSAPRRSSPCGRSRPRCAADGVRLHPHGVPVPGLDRDLPGVGVHLQPLAPSHRNGRVDLLEQGERVRQQHVGVLSAHGGDQRGGLPQQVELAPHGLGQMRIEVHVGGVGGHGALGLRDRPVDEREVLLDHPHRGGVEPAPPSRQDPLEVVRPRRRSSGRRWRAATGLTVTVSLAGGARAAPG